MEKTVLLRGAGAVTPLGADLPSSWKALLAGEMALRLGSADLPAALHCYPVGRAQLEQAVAREGLSAKQQRRLDPVTQLALCAAKEAWRAAAWPDQGVKEGPGVGVVKDARLGVVMGVGYGATTTHLKSMERLQAQRADRLSPFTIPASMPNATASQLAMAFGAQGPALTVGTACASGLDAVGLALQLLRSGQVDRVLCGGAEWIGDAMGVGGMAAAKALSKAEGDHPHVLKPFDQMRKGTAVGTGAAMFVLEAVNQVPTEGVALLGYGCSADAHHITAPLADGSGAEAAMRLALQSAGLEAKAVDAIYAHGTGTLLNDSMEAAAIARVFPELPHVTSTKGQYGHAMGASGAIHLAFAACTARYGVVPPTRPCFHPDPALPFHPVLATAPPATSRGALLVNAFGFGGHNACLLLAPLRP